MQVLHQTRGSFLWNNYDFQIKNYLKDQYLPGIGIQKHIRTSVHAVQVATIKFLNIFFIFYAVKISSRRRKIPSSSKRTTVKKKVNSWTLKIIFPKLVPFPTHAQNVLLNHVESTSRSSLWILRTILLADDRKWNK